MQYYGVVNAAALSRYAIHELEDGSTALERAVGFLEFLPGIERVYALVDGESSEHTRRLLAEHDCRIEDRREGWSIGAFLSFLSGITGEDTSFVYVYGDCPMLAPEIARRMLANHERIFADYTFADGYPLGMAPEILNSRIIASLDKLAAGDRESSLQRTSLFEVVSRDINAFDVETELSPRDLRMLRVSLTCDTRRNVQIVQRILKRIADRAPDLEGPILETLERKPAILRTLPSFYDIQIVEGCPQNCSYCPYPGMRSPEIGRQGEMPLDRIVDVLDRIRDFSEDAVIGISLWGEPSLHSQIGSVIEEVTSRDGLDLLIETSGLGWDTRALERLAGRLGKSPTWIVSLDAWTEEAYRRMRGEGYAEATGFAELLLKLFPGNAYVQSVRMKENEEDLESFYRGWKRRTENVIVQKYDSFCGELEDRRVADLSPLKRFPCWHNKRDVVILMDGDVPMCREDIGRNTLLGNAWKDELESIWARGHEIYLRPIHQDYPKLCEGCDEYYTFNF